MHLSTLLPRLAACAGTAIVGLAAFQAAATDTKVALVPGGPHPYFAAWEQAGIDAAQRSHLVTTLLQAPTVDVAGIVVGLAHHGSVRGSP